MSQQHEHCNPISSGSSRLNNFHLKATTQYTDTCKPHAAQIVSTRGISPTVNLKERQTKHTPHSLYNLKTTGTRRTGTSTIISTQSSKKSLSLTGQSPPPRIPPLPRGGLLIHDSGIILPLLLEDLLDRPVAHGGGCPGIGGQACLFQECIQRLRCGSE